MNILRMMGVGMGTLAILCGVTAIASSQEAPKKPLLPGGKWRVHDMERPRPIAVKPGDIPGAPPADAIVLFDGRDTRHWQSSLPWIVDNGVLRVPTRAPGQPEANLVTRESFGDVQLHLEFRTPPELAGPGLTNPQMRGNSGVLFMGRYEVQILDSFNSETYADGQASAIYGWKPPLVNASTPRGTWQRYDIVFEAPRFDADGKATRPATLTVFHNGVLTQLREPLIGTTLHRRAGRYEAHMPELPLEIQDHDLPVEFRNIWIRRLKLDRESDTPSS